MKVMKTTLAGVLLIEPKVFTDCRGSFVENYNLQAFKDAGLLYNFVQDNQSVSKHPGTIRGLHYQLPPHAQAKLIRVVTGAIYDVAIEGREWMGFPCLSHLSFKRVAQGSGFAVNLTAVYRSHSYCARALGNLLGLGQLLYFVAQESGLSVGTLTCLSSYAELDVRAWGGIRNTRTILA